jgi:surface antigen
MFRGFRIRLVPALAVGAGLVATGASAQLLSNQVLGAFVTLTPSDMRTVDGAVDKLFETDAPNVGKRSDWSNSETGRYGTVTVVRYFDKDDMHCRRLRFEFRSKKSKSAEATVFWNNICKLPSGERKFL